MQTTKLGATGRTVSVAGLGCGGSSRLGLSQGKSDAEAEGIVRTAVDAGVTLIDTAEAYGTEEVVGRALAAYDPDTLTLSTKSGYRRDETLLSAAEVIANLEASLKRLRRDHVDVFHVHAVRPADYDYVMNEIVPSLVEAKAAGKIGHIGITESPPNDPRQMMLTRAVYDDVWEVMMLGLHLMNHGPRRHILPLTQKNGVGTLIMFAVRSIFSRPARLSRAMKELAERGLVPADMAAREEPLAFLIEASGASSLTEVAYRFARHEPGADVVLFGTGSPAHLAANIDAINGAPLPATVQETLTRLFGHLTGVGFDRPEPVKKS